MLEFALALLFFLFIDLILWNSILSSCHSFAIKCAFIIGIGLKLFPLITCGTVYFSDALAVPWNEVLFEAPYRAALGAAVNNLTIGFVVLATQPLSNRRAFQIPTIELFRNADSRFEQFLIFAGLLKMFYWLAITDFSNPIFFIARRLDGALAMAPFFVGMTAFQLKKALKFWMVVFALQLVISAMTGTRGQAFTPILLFLIGFAVGLPDWRSRFRVGFVGLLPVGFLLSTVAVYVGIARDSVGRTDLAGALKSGSLFSRVNQETFADSGRDSNVLYQASIRLASWPPLVVPTMTPEPISFRGFEDLDEELAATTNIRIGSDIRSGLRYWPNFYLQPYGFAIHVDSDGVQTSSVEMSAFVDGFTRGGWIGGVMYCLIAYSVLMFIEFLARNKLIYTNPSLFLMLLAVISNPLRFGDNGMIGALRLLILETIMCLVIFYVFTRLIKAIPILR